MSLDKIRNYFSEQLGNFNDEDWAFVVSKFVHEKYPKKHILLRRGQKERFVSFLESGIVRYFIPKENNEITFEITFAGDFIGAYDSFISQTPSRYIVESITPISLWRLAYDDVQEIYSRTQPGDRFGRLACEKLFLEKFKRELSFLEDSAEEQYLKLLHTQPEMIKYIPQHLIASYIGVTPRH